MIDVVVENLFLAALDLYTTEQEPCLQNGYSGDRWLWKAGAEPA